MDYVDKKEQEREKQYCHHLSEGNDKETCEFYLPLVKDR